jgi:hypothetical protein
VWVFVIALAVPSVMALLGWIWYLNFCRFLVKRTNSSASLRDAAIAAKAYKAADVAQLGHAVSRMLKSPKGSS